MLEAEIQASWGLRPPEGNVLRVENVSWENHYVDKIYDNYRCREGEKYGISLPPITPSASPPHFPLGAPEGGPSPWPRVCPAFCPCRAHGPRRSQMSCSLRCRAPRNPGGRGSAARAPPWPAPWPAGTRGGAHASHPPEGSQKNSNIV